MKKFDIEQQRKAFDKWYSYKYSKAVSEANKEMAWQGWLAAQQQEGYVMVPADPSLETMQKMNRESIDSKFNTPKHRMQQVYKAMIQAAQE